MIAREEIDIMLSELFVCRPQLAHTEFTHHASAIFAHDKKFYVSTGKHLEPASGAWCRHRIFIPGLRGPGTYD